MDSTPAPESSANSLPSSSVSTERALIFDNTCPVCKSAIEAGIRFRLFDRTQVQAFDSVGGELQERLLEEGFRNKMAAYDYKLDETRLGVDAVLWLIEDSPPNLIRSFIRFPIVKNVITKVYPLIAYNRRIITPRENEIKCDCDPDPSPAHTLGLIALLAAITLTGVGLFAFLGARHFGLASPLYSAFKVQLIIAALWIAASLASTLAGSRWYIYSGHLAVVLASGFLILLPAIILSLVFYGIALSILYILSVYFSFWFMWRMLKKRIRILRQG